MRQSAMSLPTRPHRRARTWALLPAAVLLVGACGGQDTADRVIEANSITSTTAGPPTTGGTGTSMDTTSTTAPAVTLPPLDPGQTELWVFDLEVGDCFNERIRSEDDVEIETIVKVPCEDPHDNEVYDEQTFPQEPDTAYPGNSELTEFGDDRCLDAFEGFVGISYVLSVLEIGTVVPTLDSWVEGDRDLTCLLFDPNGDKLTRSMRGAEA